MPEPIKCISTDGGKTWCGKTIARMKAGNWTYSYHENQNHCGVCMRRLMETLRDRLEQRDKQRKPRG